MLRVRFVVSLVLVLAACPQANQADPAAGKVAPPPVADKRVVVEDGDLYPAKGGVVPEQPPPPSPGTGLSDETNGVCRLFAPELPDPTCCERQLGFDAAAVQAACDLKVYLGESFHGTCGYYFVADATAAGMRARWLRLSTVVEATPKAAAEAHDRRARKVDGFVPSAPIPGIEGAWWGEADDLHFAFLPGWSVVRMLTWSDASCSAEGIEKVVRQLIAAPETPAAAPRTSLVPGGATSPAIPAAGERAAEVEPAEAAGERGAAPAKPAKSEAKSAATTSPASGGT